MSEDGASGGLRRKEPPARSVIRLAREGKKEQGRGSHRDDRIGRNGRGERDCFNTKKAAEVRRPVCEIRGHLLKRSKAR